MRFSSTINARSAACLVVALHSFWAISAYPQPTDGTFIEALPYQSASLTLTPETPGATRSLVIDAVRGADIMVSSPSQDLEVKLVSPRRVHYTVGQTRPGFQSFISRYEGLASTWSTDMPPLWRTTWS